MLLLALAVTGVWIVIVLAGVRRTLLIARDRAGGGQRYRRQARQWQDLLFILPYEPFVDRLAKHSSALTLMAGVQSRLNQLEGNGKAGGLGGSGGSIREAGRRFMAECLGHGFAAAGGVALLAAAADEPAMLAIALAAIPLLPAMRIRRLYRSAEERRRAIVTALPALLGKLTLLVGAGETVQAALFRCADAGDADSALYAELKRSVHAIRNGESFRQAMERFGRRCGVQEAAVFTAAILLNYQKGGDRFVMSLRELSYGLWEKRKAIARIRAEEAASKLSFPLVVVFLVLMVIIGAPAILSM
jgi:tight adherence protein C